MYRTALFPGLKQLYANVSFGSVRIASGIPCLPPTCRACFGAIFLLALSFACSPGALGQPRPGVGQGTAGGIVVRVQGPDNAPYDQAIVNLRAFSGAPIATATSVDRGQANFQGLPKATYIVEVLAPGFENWTQNIELSATGDEQWVYVTLKPLGGGTPTQMSSGPPILAPGTQKELNKAMEALRSDKPEEAKKHLDKAVRSAPSNPDVNYLLGMYYVQNKDYAHAEEYWKKAIQIYPAHTFSLSALGELQVQKNNQPDAINYLKRAVDASPSSWRYEGQLAEAYLLHGDCAEAATHAQRGVELGKDRAVSAQFTLAKALVCQKRVQPAQEALAKFLAENPDPSDAQEASRMLESLKQPSSSIAAATSGNTSDAGKSASTGLGDTVKRASPSTAVASGPLLARADLLPPAKWMPPDVDESMPAVDATVACPLQKITDETAKRVSAFVDGVNRISATEMLDHEVIDRYGLIAKHETRKFGYVESLYEVKPGMYRVEEYRDGTMGLDVFPERLASLGLGSLVMIFHPVYRDEYDVTCEGLSHWHNKLVWQLHFRQKKDKPSRLREYSIGKQVFPVGLRGRAWIAADTYQVVSLETDLVAPIPQIRLAAEHTSIDYAPVKFRNGYEELWLPQNAELFFDFGGRRIHRRHHFDDYRLFSIDEQQKISAPPSEADLKPGSDPSQ